MNKDCVSLEVALKLQKAGYKSACVKAWLIYPKLNCDCSLFYKKPVVSEYMNNIRHQCPDNNQELFPKKIPAPTATQLAEELPARHPEDTMFTLEIEKHPIGNGYHIWYTQLIGSITEIKTGWQFEKTLPDALGLMMVYLLENGLLLTTKELLSNK